MAAKGGDWGLVTRGAFRIKEVNDALFALKGGEVGPLIETPQTFYIIKAIERQDARTVPLTEVQAKLEDEIRQAKFNESVSNYIQQLYERSYVRVMMENL
jgi:parvulin-like peptidyl-prolyl isomerase